MLIYSRHLLGDAEEVINIFLDIAAYLVSNWSTGFTLSTIRM